MNDEHDCTSIPAQRTRALLSARTFRLAQLLGQEEKGSRGEGVAMDHTRGRDPSLP